MNCKVSAIVKTTERAEGRLAPSKALAVMLVCSAMLVSGCMTDRGLSLVDYDAISASAPPKALEGLWAGPHAGGELFIEIFSDGGVRTCLSAPPYHQQLAGKYSDQALYLEDGTRIEIEAKEAHIINIFSPPGRPAATLVSDSGDPDAQSCFAISDSEKGALRNI
jgi:hypothetical protein